MTIYNLHNIYNLKNIGQNLKMKIKYILSQILILSTFCSFGQRNSVDLMCDSIYNEIVKKDSNSQWKINYHDNLIFWTLIDTIHFEPGCCAGKIKDLHKIDTITIQLRFEKDWYKKNIDSIKKSNIEIIEILTSQAIKIGDSINWGIKTSKKSFLDYPYKYLSSYWEFRKKGEFNIENVVRLPDTIINNIGVFVEVNFDYWWFTIYQEIPRKKFMSKLEFVSLELLYLETPLTGNFKYK